MRFPFFLKKSPPKPSVWRRRVLAAISVLVFADSLYLYVIWPDWKALGREATPKSSFIKAYEEAAADNIDLPHLHWTPVPIVSMSPFVRRAVIVSEDYRFYKHDGIDPEAILDAIEYNWEKGKVVFGASTISQQTVKNLFLSASRDPLRKWHELVLTLAMEKNLRKRKILELYLNVAEFDEGIYGVEAAAKHYWGISASELTEDQAVSLAACLPSPKLHNPRTNTRTFQQRRARITRHMDEFRNNQNPAEVPRDASAHPVGG